MRISTPTPLGAQRNSRVPSIATRAENLGNSEKLKNEDQEKPMITRYPAVKPVTPGTGEPGTANSFWPDGDYDFNWFEDWVYETLIDPGYSERMRQVDAEYPEYPEHLEKIDESTRRKWLYGEFPDDASSDR